MAKKAKGEQAIATVTIHGAATMTPKGRLEVGRWLQACGAHLVAKGKVFAPRFRARYFVSERWK